MSYQRLRPTFTFDADRLAQLRAIAPEAFADGKINWEALRAALGEHLEDEGADAEHFGLFWPGKRAARRRASEPPRGTLIPVPGAGVDEETTRNLFIEADNLEALKLLQKAYAGRVKMIYIDPPYNTGNDFIYRDDFREAAEDYLRRTGQVDESLRPLTTNPRTGGRFHSNWLNMIYPRLLLARTLLRDDGVIFVSIDDNEVANLRLIMDEIFGAEQFVSLITVQTNPRGRTLDKFIAKTHEFVLIYTKADAGLFQVAKDETQLAEYDQEDDSGRYRELELRNRNPVFNRLNRPNLFYPFFADPTTGRVSLQPGAPFTEGPIFPLNSRGEEGCWTWGREKAAREEHLLIARKVNTGMWRVFRKDYLPQGGARTKVKSIWTDTRVNHEYGKEEVGRLFSDSPFDFPKSVHLIEQCILLGSEPTTGDIILDFFAGSGTTAHAVMAQNAEDGGSRQFILVQLPEETGRADYPTISAICAERIRRAGKKIAEERAGRLPDPDAAPLDVGFRFLRFAPSHFKAWQDYEGDDLAALETLFSRFETPLVDGWRAENLLTEVMLQLGFPLDSRVEPLPDFSANAVVRVSSDFHAHRLYACLDAAIAQATIDALALDADDLFVCLDSALTDQAKARLADVCNLRTI